MFGHKVKEEDVNRYCYNLFFEIKLLISLSKRRKIRGIDYYRKIYIIKQIKLYLHTLKYRQKSLTYSNPNHSLLKKDIFIL